MTLNNCTTCGRKPDIKVIGFHNYYQCECGKVVSATGAIYKNRLQPGVKV